MSSFRLICALWLTTAMVSVACSGDDTDHGADRPLQPLIYTEDPELTPQGAAVREERLQRQLLEGAADGDWGRLGEEDASDLEPIDDPQQLGKTIVDALLQSDQQRWEHSFVSPNAYVSLVGVDQRQASEFVDNIIGQSRPIWETFDQAGGAGAGAAQLDEQLEFVELKLGTAHRVDGSRTGDHEEAAQFTGNRLVLHHDEFDVRFELTIDRIFRIEAGEEQQEEHTHHYHLGSAVGVSGRFDTFLEVGFHRDPRVLRSGEYPFPLGVGTFWRYQRFHADEEPQEDDPMDTAFEQSAGLYAEELIIEVREVSNYSPVRLVELLYAYDDRRHTRVRQWWVATPNRIYLCDQHCRDNIDQLDALLDYFARTRPLLKFPLESVSSWTTPGRDSSVVSVDDQWHDMQTPAGSFTNSFRVDFRPAHGGANRYVRDVNMTWYFAPGRGVVRRDIEPGPDAREDIPVTEQLIEYRLMD